MQPRKSYPKHELRKIDRVSRWLARGLQPASRQSSWHRRGASLFSGSHHDRQANVRRIVGLVLMLLALGWLASELPSRLADNAPNITTSWRRTRDGWQRLSTLATSRPTSPPQLHPLVVAAFEGLLFLAGMVAFSGGATAASRPRAAQIGRSTKGSGKWAAGSGRWPVGGGKWAASGRHGEK